MPDLKRILAALERQYGRPEPPPAKGPFELVLWENACYLLPDERRAEVFAGLRERVGLTAEAIWNAPDSELLPLAARSGMQPETRVMRWREIARIALQEFDGNLDRVLTMEYAKARKALRKFPSIGEPGAEKILMFCGVAAGLPLESNGLRVLVRIGYGRANPKNYGAMYKSVQEAVAGELPKEIPLAHLLLRAHGKTQCKDAAPRCEECPLAASCLSRAM